jgi:hypothetical protein
MIINLLPIKKQQYGVQKIKFSQKALEETIKRSSYRIKLIIAQLL